MIQPASLISSLPDQQSRPDFVTQLDDMSRDIEVRQLDDMSCDIEGRQPSVPQSLKAPDSSRIRVCLLCLFSVSVPLT